MIIWFTGLSGSGKTTLCKLLASKLYNEGYTVEWLDGDNVRKELKIESDFSKEGILKNNFEIINRIKLLEKKVDFILISLITPYEEIRKKARNTLGKKYFEVYLKCDKKILIKRDTKGLYNKAIKNEIDNLIGFSAKSPYEEPKKPNLIIETDLIITEKAVSIIYNKLMINYNEQ